MEEDNAKSAIFPRDGLINAVTGRIYGNSMNLGISEFKGARSVFLRRLVVGK